MNSNLHWRKRTKKKLSSNFYPPLGNLGISHRRTKGKMLRAGKDQDDASEADRSAISYQSVDSNEEDDATQREKASRRKEKDPMRKYTRFWSRLRKGDQDVIKTLLLCALLFLVVVRLTAPSTNAPPTILDTSSSLRSSNSAKIQDDEDNYDPTLKSSRLSGQSNSMLEQQQLALLQVQQQQQQQQQVLLTQAHAQKQAEDQLRSQAVALQQQQQQQQYQALMMQQQAMLQQQATQMAMMQNVAALGTHSQSQSQLPAAGVAMPLAQEAAPEVIATNDATAATSETDATEETTVATSTETSGEGMPLEELANFEDTWEPYNEKSIPIYWHIPKAGGSTVKDTIGACHRLVMATEFGITDGHDQDTEIAVVYPKPPGGVTDDRSPFVNVDTTTPAGIERAAKMGFADANLAGCVVTPFLYESNALFTQTGKGRLFAVFRHPIDRAVSMFYYIQVATWGKW